VGKAGGLLIIGIGVIVVIMGIKGTWANLFPPGMFQNFLNPTGQAPAQQPSTGNQPVTPPIPNNPYTGGQIHPPQS
jgi:hypothetical protein